MEVYKGEGRPEGGYRVNGNVVPSTTEILSRYKNSAALIQWAAKHGTAGVRDLMDEASAVGNAVHDAAELTIHYGREVGHKEVQRLLDPDELEQAKRSFGRWLKWFDQVPERLRWIETEVPYISERWGFAGTMDALAKRPEGLWIYDWKTSKTIGFDYILQMGAYGALVSEYFEVFPAGATIVRVDKAETPYAKEVETLEVRGAELRRATKCFLRLLRAFKEEESFLEYMGMTY